MIIMPHHFLLSMVFSILLSYDNIHAEMSQKPTNSMDMAKHEFDPQNLLDELKVHLMNDDTFDKKQLDQPWLMVMACQIIRADRESADQKKSNAEIEQFVMKMCANGENGGETIERNAKDAIMKFGGQTRLIQMISMNGPKILHEMREKEHIENCTNLTGSYIEILWKLFEKLPGGSVKNAIGELLVKECTMASDLLSVMVDKVWPSFFSESNFKQSMDHADFDGKAFRSFRTARRLKRDGEGVMAAFYFLIACVLLAGGTTGVLILCIIGFFVYAILHN